MSLQQKAPDSGSFNEPPLGLCSKGEVNVLLFEAVNGSTVKQYRTEPATPLNKNTNLSLSPSHPVLLVLTASLAEVVTAEKKMLDFMTS